MDPGGFDLSTTLSFSTFTTAAGAAIAGIVIRFIVEWLAMLAPDLRAKLAGSTWAGIVALLLYIATALATRPGTADAWLNLVWSMIVATMAAVALNSIVEHYFPKTQEGSPVSGVPRSDASIPPTG